MSSLHKVRWPKQRGLVVLAVVALGLLALLVVALLSVGIAAAWYWNDLPPLDKATD